MERRGEVADGEEGRMKSEASDFLSQSRRVSDRSKAFKRKKTPPLWSSKSIHGSVYLSGLAAM